MWIFEAVSSKSDIVPTTCTAPGGVDKEDGSYHYDKRDWINKLLRIIPTLAADS